MEELIINLKENIDRSYPTSPKFINLVGRRFGMLEVEEYYGFTTSKSDSRTIYYICKCDCGNRICVSGNSLTTENTKSCGCYRKAFTSTQFKTHGFRKSRIYKIYHGMKKRCYNVNCKSYSRYGGRGIYICDEWLNGENGFITFYNWSIENGYDDTLSIDRIDNDGPYSPENCRWTTIDFQAKNTSKNVYITYCSYTLPLSVWSVIAEIPYKILYGRLFTNGWSVYDSLTIPTGYHRRKSKNVERRILCIPQEYIKYNCPEKEKDSIRDI